MIKLKECSFSKLKNFLKRGKYYTYYQLFGNGNEEKVMFKFLSLSTIPPIPIEDNKQVLYHSNSRLKLTNNDFKFCSKMNRDDYFYVFLGNTGDDFGFSSRIKKSYICEIFRYKTELKKYQKNESNCT